MENMFSENMNQISLATNHLDSYEFTVAVNNFEVFLEQQYLHRSEQKSVQELLNDIFNEIVVIKNPLAAVIIVKLLTKVKFDDKVQKAIKISHHILVVLGRRVGISLQNYTKVYVSNFLNIVF